jgi:hypothetical protein
MTDKLELYQKILDKGGYDRIPADKKGAVDRLIERGNLTMPGTKPTVQEAPEETGSTLGRVASAAIQQGTTLSNVGEVIAGDNPKGWDSLTIPMKIDMIGNAPKMMIQSLFGGKVSPSAAKETFPLTLAMRDIEKKNIVKEGSGEQLAGTAAAMILDPINLAFGAVGTGTKLQQMLRASGIGSGISVTQDTAAQLAQTGEIDPSRTVAALAVGAASPFIVEGVFSLARAAGSTISKAAGKSTIAQKLAERKAQKMVDTVSRKAAAFRDEGLSAPEAVAKALRDTGYQPKPYWETVFANGKPKVSSVDDAYNQAIDKGVANAKPVSKAAIVGRKAHDAVASTMGRLNFTVGRKDLLGHFDSFLGRSVATELEKIHPNLGKALRLMEMEKTISIGNDSRAVLRWRAGVRALPKPIQQQLKSLLSDGKREEALKIMRAFDTHKDVAKALAPKNTEAMWGKSNWRPTPRDATGTAFRVNPRTFSQEFEESVLPVLDQIGNDLISSQPIGRGIQKLDNYFPRIIKDYQGFLNNTTRGRLIQARSKELLSAEKARLGRELTLAEREELILSEMTKGEFREKVVTKARAEYQRKFKTIRDEELDYFMDPGEALEAYIHNSREVISHRNLLGLGQQDVPTKINTLLANMTARGELTESGMLRAQELLQARLGNGTAQMAKILGQSKNFFYATTLTNPASAMIQFGDTALAGVMNGIKPTVQAIAKTIAHANNLPEIDASKTFDLVRLTEEMIETRSTGAVLTRLFKYSGFTEVDKFGKNVNIQSTLNKARSLVLNSDDSVTALQKEFGNSLFTPREWAEVADDLAKGKISENIKFMTFNRLAESQPISLSEMPEKYLNSPNGRIWYAMKSYALKQLDLVRKRGFDLLATPGRQSEGAKFLMQYAGFLGSANLGIEEIKNHLMGRELDRGSSITDDVAWSALKSIGLSEFLAEDVTRALQTRNPVDLAKAIFLPAAVEHAFRTAGHLGNAVMPNEGSEDDMAKRFAIIRQVPIVGNLIHNYFLGGNNQFNEWAEKYRNE